MKLLWTLSNEKRTGPVEPSLDLAAALVGRGHDVAVLVARPRPGKDPESRDAARARGLPVLELGTHLHKHAFVLRDRPDRRRIARWLRAERPDAVVTTLANDHRVLLGAARAAGGVPVVRLWFAAGDAPLARRERQALVATDAVVAFADGAVDRLARLGLPRECRHRLEPPLDVEGVRERATGRDRHGVPDERFLVGLVARIQAHRRFDLVWDAAERLRDADASVHLLVVGRGTHARRIAEEPVRRRGLADRVTFAGYLRGEAYASTLAALDAQVLLVPGSDPTCRALREGMALGVPSLATRRGMLPSIVADGSTGLLVDETPDALATAIRRLAADRALARRMGEAARRRADAWDVRDVAARLEAVLASLV